MGVMESASKKRRKRAYIQHAVLKTVAGVGIISLALLAPNVFQVFPQIIGKKRYKLAFQTRTAIQRLALKGHIKFVTRGRKKFIEITDAGKNTLALEEARTLGSARMHRRWDGKYRMVMFDIPEKRKGARERLRHLMHAFGFLRLQDSVWISPYDCEDLIALVKAELRMGKDVLYVIADSIENDGWIKKHFALS